MVQRTINSEQLYSASQAARRLKVRESVVCRYCRLGRLKARKFGNAWLIVESDLEEFAAKPRPRGNPLFQVKARQ